jgi:hypothetical protein
LKIPAQEQRAGIDGHCEIADDDTRADDGEVGTWLDSGAKSPNEQVVKNRLRGLW